jgi:hypothetical protein
MGQADAAREHWSVGAFEENYLPMGGRGAMANINIDMYFIIINIKRQCANATITITIAIALKFFPFFLPGKRKRIKDML